MNDTPKNLAADYTYAVYTVIFKGREIRVYIGQSATELDMILMRHSSESYALITAYNPRSTLLSEAENQARNCQLSAELRQRGFEFLEGCGASSDGSWPSEPSFFIVGISEPEAVEVARMFDQHAIVYGEKGIAPRLVWCEDH
jgi:hypothetical protein